MSAAAASEVPEVSARVRYRPHAGGWGAWRLNDQSRADEALQAVAGRLEGRSGIRSSGWRCIGAGERVDRRAGKTQTTAHEARWQSRHVYGVSLYVVPRGEIRRAQEHRETVVEKRKQAIHTSVVGPLSAKFPFWSYNDLISVL